MKISRGMKKTKIPVCTCFFARSSSGTKSANISGNNTTNNIDTKTSFKLQNDTIATS